MKYKKSKQCFGSELHVSGSPDSHSRTTILTGVAEPETVEPEPKKGISTLALRLRSRNNFFFYSFSVASLNES